MTDTKIRVQDDSQIKTLKLLGQDQDRIDYEDQDSNLRNYKTTSLVV